MAMQVAAIREPIWLYWPIWLLSSCRPAVTGILLMSLNTKVGHRKSFQAPVKLNRKMTIRIGRMAGSMMRVKIWKSVAPSISAASSSSFGMPFMKLRTRKMFATLPRPGMMQAQ